MCLKEYCFPNCWKVLNTMTKLHLWKASGPDSIPVVVVNNCKPELSYILLELFNMCLKKSCFPDFSKVFYVVLAFKNVKERAMTKNCHSVSLPYVMSKIFETLAKNRRVNNFHKYLLCSDCHYCLRLSWSTRDLLKVTPDRILRVVSSSRATRALALDISKAFDRVWHACPLHKVKFYRLSGHRWRCMVLDGESHQEYPVNAGPPHGSILDHILFLLYINGLLGVILNIILYCKCEQASWFVANSRVGFWTWIEPTRHWVNWGKRCLLDFSSGKTQLVLFD